MFESLINTVKGWNVESSRIYRDEYKEAMIAGSLYLFYCTENSLSVSDIYNSLVECQQLNVFTKEKLAEAFNLQVTAWQQAKNKTTAINDWLRKLDKARSKYTREERLSIVEQLEVISSEFKNEGKDIMSEIKHILMLGR